MVTEWPDLAINKWIMNIHYDLVNQFPIQQKGFLFCLILLCFVLVCLVFCFCLFCFYFVLYVCCCCFCLFVCLFHTPQKLKWVMLAHKDIKTFEKMRNPKWKLRLNTTVIGWTYYFAGSFPNLSKPLDRGHDFFWIFFKVTKNLVGCTVIHKGWDLKKLIDSPMWGGGVLNKNYQKFSSENLVYLYDLLWGWPIIFMSKGGGLKSKYSCAVHSDFFCLASDDICRHGLLHVATRVEYTNICRTMRSNEVWMHH